MIPLKTSKLFPFSLFRAKGPDADRGATPRRRAPRKPRNSFRPRFEELESRRLLSALALTPLTLPGDTVNRPYSHAITASGGVGPVALVVSNDQGATGLTVPASGTGSLTIGGTPTATGTETFTVTATDSETPPVQVVANYSITVNPVLSLNPAPLPADTQYVAYNQVITPTGGTRPTLVVSNLQNPIPGLTVPAGSVTGSLTISGTPTATGTVSFTVTANDSAGGPSASANYSITVNPWVDPPGIALSLGGIAASGYASFLDPNQNLVVAGGAGNNTNYQMAVARYTPNGNLETSFNGTGFTTTSGPSAGLISANAAADYPSSPSHKIVVGGAFDPAKGGMIGEFALARYNANGSLDTTFGTKGEVVTNFGGSPESGISGVVVLPSGDIVAAGCATGTNGLGFGGFALACYTPAGKLDTTFKPAAGDPVAFTTPNGTVTTTFGGASSSSGVSAVTLETVGSKTYILAVGLNQSTVNGVVTYAMARYNLDGSLDKTFGSNGNGLVTTQILSGSGAESSAASVVVDPSGNIFVGGSGLQTGTPQVLTIAKYSPSGVLDTTFTNNNIANNVVGGAYSLAIQPQTGKILASGARPAGPGPNEYYSAAVVRFNSDGSLDTSFGAAGFAVAPAAAPLRLALTSMNIQSSGGIVIAGDGWIPAAQQNYVALAQFSPDGTLNTSFGGSTAQAKSVSPASVSVTPTAATAQPLSASTSPATAATEGSSASATGAAMLPLPTIGAQAVGVTGAQKVTVRRGSALLGLPAWSVDRVLADLPAVDLKTALLAEEMAF